MAINPLTAFVGRITAADVDYPYGSSKNETTAGAGDGTPYEKIRADDIFGLQQSLLDEAGIVPSGDAETVPDSQYKEAIRIINNMRNVSHNMASDANYTLTAIQNRFRRITITDTGVVLSAARDIIVDDSERRFIAINSTAQELTFRTLSGTGIAIAAGESADLVCDGTDVVDTPGASVGVVGKLLQSVNFTTGAYAESATQTPYDDTIPQITEGTQFMTLAITPISATSKLKITVAAEFASTSSGQMTLALFRDAAVNSIGAMTNGLDAADMNTNSFVVYVDSTAAVLTNFYFRMGKNASGTSSFNGRAGARQLGGAHASSITIEEIEV